MPLQCLPSRFLEDNGRYALQTLNMSPPSKSGFSAAMSGTDETASPISICHDMDHDTSMSMLSQQLFMSSFDGPSTPSTLPLLSRSNTVSSSASSSSSQSDSSPLFRPVDFCSSTPVFRTVDYSISPAAAVADGPLSPLDRPPTPPMWSLTASQGTQSHAACTSSLRSQRRNALSSPSTSPRLPTRLLLLETASRRQRRPEIEARLRIIEGRRDAVRTYLAEATGMTRAFLGAGSSASIEQGDDDNDNSDDEAVMDCRSSARANCSRCCSSSSMTGLSRRAGLASAGRKVVGAAGHAQPRRVTS